MNKCVVCIFYQNMCLEALIIHVQQKSETVTKRPGLCRLPALRLIIKNGLFDYNWVGVFCDMSVLHSTEKTDHQTPLASVL